MPSLAERIALINEAAQDDLSGIWTGLDYDEIITALFDLLPAIVDTWSLGSASLAADWYDDLRQDKAIKGRFTAIVPDLGDLGADELAGWASQPLRLIEPNLELAQSRVTGGLQRRIAKGARDTIAISSIEDPQARGWRRVARGNGCPWCQMLASRGFVYSKASVDFAAHDHCNCTATPAFKGEPIPVKPYVPKAK